MNTTDTTKYNHNTKVLPIAKVSFMEDLKASTTANRSDATDEIQITDYDVLFGRGKVRALQANT